MNQSTQKRGIARRRKVRHLAATLVALFANRHHALVRGFSIETQIHSKHSSIGEQSTASAASTAQPPSLPPKSPKQQQRRKSQRDQKPPICTEVDKSNGREKRIQQPSSIMPYQAGYYVSVKTQKRLQDVAADALNIPFASDRATRVLEAFLATPPHQCNAANIVCALTSSAKLLERAGTMTDRFETLLYQTCDIARDMLTLHLLTARQICNLAWAIAKFHDVNPHVLPHPDERLALSSNKVLGQAETWNLEQQSLSYGLDLLVDQIALELCNMLRNRAACAKVGELAMVSWAYGVLRPRRKPPGWKHVPQLDEMRKVDAVRKQKGAQQSSSNEQFLIRYETWSMGNLRERVPVEAPTATKQLFDAISDALLCHDSAVNGTLRLSSCRWNELATTAWAFASHGHCSSIQAQNLLLAISSETANRLRRAAGSKTVLSRDISQIVWALGNLQSDNFRLADGLLELIAAVDEYSGVSDAAFVNSRPFLDWSCVDIVQILVSMAHARLDEEALLRALYEEAYIRLSQGIGRKNIPPGRRDSFSAWEVSMLLWVQARLYLKERQGIVFARFPSRAAKQILASSRQAGSLEQMQISIQEQANLAWSLTVLQAHESSDSAILLSNIFSEVVLVCGREGVIHLEHAHQLWQALFLLEDDCPAAVDKVPRWLYEYLQSRWKAEKARPKISSARHQALSQTLKLMGVHHVNEHDEDIDVAIVLQPKASWTHEATLNVSNNPAAHLDSIKVAVEFDGPNHFTRQREPGRGETPRPLGQNVLKYRILKKQGWTVVRVPYYEFDKIPFWASMERQRYLQRLLKTHGNLRFSDADVSAYKVQVPNRRTRFD
ncbi:hypothetical protein MPSEU_000731300 [Mayamaea pseudoterrestris]|nr:hypothetical protein MPSEU_000731300 [Mayamaea pseudoterrestris]